MCTTRRVRARARRRKRERSYIRRRAGIFTFTRKCIPFLLYTSFSLFPPRPSSYMRPLLFSSGLFGFPFFCARGQYCANARCSDKESADFQCAFPLSLYDLRYTQCSAIILYTASARAPSFETTRYIQSGFQLPCCVNAFCDMALMI